MTEDEAKTKWCPFARVGSSETGLGSINRDVSTLSDARRQTMEQTRCIGSACMAWRTADAPRETLRNYHDDPEIMGHHIGGEKVFPDGWQYEHTDKDRANRKFDLLHRIAADDAPPSGFCGLAGRPA